MSDILWWLLGLAAAVLLFLAMRELVCWYFKINKMVDLLGQIDKRLESMGGNLNEEEAVLSEDTPLGKKLAKKK